MKNTKKDTLNYFISRGYEKYRKKLEKGLGIKIERNTPQVAEQWLEGELKEY